MNDFDKELLKNGVSKEDIDDFNKWNDAKKEKDFALADTYRQKLIDKGLL